jgi:hypothetical protein
MIIGKGRASLWRWMIQWLNAWQGIKRKGQEFGSDWTFRHFVSAGGRLFEERGAFPGQVSSKTAAVCGRCFRRPPVPPVSDLRCPPGGGHSLHVPRRRICAPGLPIEFLFEFLFHMDCRHGSPPRSKWAGRFGVTQPGGWRLPTSSRLL